MLLNDKTYNLLKKIVQIVLPALATLYTGLASLWNWPAVAAVVGSITLVTTFLGVVLGISTKNFNNQPEQKPDGSLIVSTDEGEKYFALGINKDAFENIDGKEFVRLNVVRNKPPAE